MITQTGRGQTHSPSASTNPQAIDIISNVLPFHFIERHDKHRVDYYTPPHRSHHGGKKTRSPSSFSHQYVPQRFQETEEKKNTQSKAFFLSDEHLWPAMGLPRPHNVTKVNNALCHFILELMMLLFVGQLHFFCFIAYAHFFSFQSHPLQASSHHAPSCMQLASSSIRLL